MVAKDKKRKIHFRYIFFTFLAFMFGIVSARQLYQGSLEYIFVSAAVLLTVAILLLMNKKIVAIFVLLGLFFVGNGWYFLGATTFNVQEYDGEVKVEGRITDKIIDYNYSYEVLLDDVKINGRNGKNINLRISNMPSQPKAGDIISFEGELEPVKAFTLKMFNSSDYRSGARYNASVSYEMISLKEGKLKLDERIRLGVKSLLFEHMSDKSAGIAYAVLFGDKIELDNEIETSYRNSGIIHILTVSGLHVGFLVALLSFILKKCKANKYVTLIVITLFLFAYSYLCGFSPSVMRAAIMAIVLMLSKICNRRYDSLNSLALAGAIICIFRPLSPYDLGFMMSFFCVFSIITLMPIISRILSRFIPRKVADVISLSLCAQIGVLPFLAYFGSQVHLLSFVLNLIIVPLFGVVYPYLFVVSFLGAFLRFLGVLLVPVDYVFRAFNVVVIFFDWSNLTFPISARMFALIVIFFVLIFGVSGYVMIDKIKKFIFVGLTSLLFAFTLGFYQIPTKFYPNVVYLSSGSSYALILTNSKKQTISIGYDYNMDKYCQDNKINNLNVNISLQGIGDFELDRLSEYGINSFIAPFSMSDDPIITTVSDETPQQLADYVFQYVKFNDEVVGLYIKMDNSSIFVATYEEIDYNIVETVSNIYQPDLVFAGKNDALAYGDYICVTRYNHYIGDYSYFKDGNMQFKLKDGRWKAVHLD